MNSCLYRGMVMHHRLAPKKHRFNYDVFMFYVDLEELPLLSKKLFLFSVNRFNFFSFRDKEHLQLPLTDPNVKLDTRGNIISYLKQNGIFFEKGRVMLLTNMNVLGYNFNPVSFYYCFDENEKPVACVAEVSNTYREMKPYLLTDQNLKDNSYHLNTKKYFYVSPFIDHDTDFDFNLSIPGEKLSIRIDDHKENERFFISTVTGKRRPLNNRALAWYSFRFPFITLKIIFLIHWNALLLWLKKLPFHPKAANQHLQRDVYNKYQNK